MHIDVLCTWRTGNSAINSCACVVRPVFCRILIHAYWNIFVSNLLHPPLNNYTLSICCTLTIKTRSQDDNRAHHKCYRCNSHDVVSLLLSENDEQNTPKLGILI